MILSSLRQRICTLTSRPSGTRFFAAVSRTVPRLEKKTIVVPIMGDSITEGTIVEWVVQAGQAVQPDDVVCLVETDKVTVDIKAEVAGVITQQFGEVDDTVEVGESLYEIDTDAQATVEASPAPVSESATEASVADKKRGGPASESADTASVEATIHSKERTPSIQFLGKEGWAQLLSPKPQPKVSGKPGSPNATVIAEADPSMYSPMYGRPLFSEEEMEALVMGGASTAPRLVTQGTAATFK